MSELTELLVEVSPSLKAGWLLWSAGGLALGVWYWLARATPLPVTVQLAAGPVPPSLSPPAEEVVPDTSQPGPEESSRPSKTKSRSFRRKD